MYLVNGTLYFNDIDENNITPNAPFPIDYLEEKNR